ncbi:phosphohistidine phosphatase [Micromonas pusilla CCMP1545]|uniref:Phosphohistidine phosphatase n=1 Tax=Micromonas pusilla (strain CCMP1545) TaxID=564608 RepID=C1MJM8_MICPC|nr:phosphohistidine phosphatase [Micromonas pusilla CCMP1545]EEH59223.1 phosphohistidine phosphatase [Micromonas pusilla CCMP1545]|eukprot:XP_003055847.1 phosphohistidine phosphatase [Micromonas pusilla CCMP1545]
MSSATAPRVRASAPRARLPRPTTTTTTTTRRPAAASASPLHRRSLLRRGRVAARAASASADAPPPNTPLRMIVLRHSDSCTEDASLKDHDRPLTSRGRALANGLAKALAASDDGGDGAWGAPDLVLCSASTRSRETLEELVRAHAPIGDATTHFLGSLYHFAAMDGVTAAHLKETIVKTSEAAAAEKKKNGGGGGGVKTVMCIGHNKGWEEAASEFAGEPVKLNVANAALLEYVGDGGEDWAKVFDGARGAGGLGEKSGAIRVHVRPRAVEGRSRRGARRDDAAAAAGAAGGRHVGGGRAHPGAVRVTKTRQESSRDRRVRSSGADAILLRIIRFFFTYVYVYEYLRTSTRA